MKKNLGFTLFLLICVLISLMATAQADELDLTTWLAKHPLVSDALRWEDANGTKAYSDWSVTQKADLHKTYQTVRNGQSIELTDPPPNMVRLADNELSLTVLSKDQAWPLFLAYVAYSLTVETREWVPWSLTEYSQEELLELFDGSRMFRYNSKFGGYEPTYRGIPAPPDFTFEFLRANNMIVQDRLNTIGNLLDWCRSNMIHYSGPFTAKNVENHWQYRGAPPISRVISGTTGVRVGTKKGDNSRHLISGHFTGGCWGTTALLRAVLRVVNIPVKDVTARRHSLPYFMSEGKYLSHGDDPYDQLSRNMNHPHPFPVEELFIDQATYDAWFGPNVPPAVNNVGRRSRELAIKYLPRALLVERCRDLEEGNSHVNSFVYNWTAFNRDYSVEELEAINLWDRMDAKIDNLGGCPALAFTLLKISGTVTTSDNLLVVEVRDSEGQSMEGHSVRFTVTSGGGMLSFTSVMTDANGRAENRLTLGPEIGMNRVSAWTYGAEQPVIFSDLPEVDISDPNLRAKIATTVNKKPDAPITVVDMETLTRLEASNANISSLIGLEFATNLTTLDLTGNSFSDISPVAGLTNLTGLYLPSNHITDLSPLSSLTNLKTLRLNDNSISNLSSLVANTGLGDGDEVNVKGNPLSYLSIHTHIPTLKSRGVKIEFDNRTPTPPLKISGDDQQGAPGAALERPFVVEVQDGTGAPFEGVPVTFTITAGGGVVHPEAVLTDENGRAQSTLTLGFDASTNTVRVSIEGISKSATFNAVAEIGFDLSVPSGINLIHIPLKVTAVGGVAKTIASIADLYDALGGASKVNFLITYDFQTQGWFSYFGDSDTDTSADTMLTDDTGILAGMTAPVSIRLRGNPLGTNGNSAINLNLGINLVGLPLRDSRINRVSDLFALDGIGGNVPVIILTHGGEFKAVGRAEDPGNIEITGGQAFILTAQRAAMVATSGDGWYNTSAMAAASPIGNADLHSLVTGIQVTDTTPVLGLRGSIVDEETSINQVGMRVTVKNLSTGRKVTTATSDGEAGYRFTVVDIETGRAAQIGDILEISAQSPNPFIGVEPLRYTVTVEDVKQNRIELPTLVAYEIPAETELLANYPNPFNPETWIPYRLAEDAFVTLTIYDNSGQAIRTLEVGHQVAAAYENWSKAVYWDGRNNLGEQVASGICFYHLSAGDYSATRRMVILK